MVDAIYLCAIELGLISGWWRKKTPNKTCYWYSWWIVLRRSSTITAMIPNRRNNPLLRHHTQSLLLFVLPSWRGFVWVWVCRAQAIPIKFFAFEEPSPHTHMRTLVRVCREFFFSLRLWIDKIKSPENNVYLHFGRNFSLCSTSRRIFRRFKTEKSNRIVSLLIKYLERTYCACE